MRTKQTLLAGVAGIALIAAGFAAPTSAQQSNMSTTDRVTNQQQAPGNQGGGAPGGHDTPRSRDHDRAADAIRRELERRDRAEDGVPGPGGSERDDGASDAASVDSALGAFEDEAGDATGDGIRRHERFADHPRQRQIPEERHTPTPGGDGGGTGSPSDRLPDPGGEHYRPGGPGSGAEAGLDREASGGEPGPVTNPGGFAHGAVSPEQFREAGADVVTTGPNSTYAEGTYQDSEGNMVHWQHHSVRNDDGSTTTHLQERTHYPDGSETVTRTKTECDAGGNCHSEDDDFGIRITGDPDSDSGAGSDGAGAGSDAGAGDPDMEFSEDDVYGDSKDSDSDSGSDDSSSDDSGSDDSTDDSSDDSTDDSSDDSSSDDSDSDESSDDSDSDDSSDSGDDGSDDSDSGEDGESSGDVGCDPRVPDAGGCDDGLKDRAAPWRYDEEEERQERNRDNLISGDPVTQPDPSDDGASGGGRNPRGNPPDPGPDGDPFGPGHLYDVPTHENCFTIGCVDFVTNPDPTP